MGCWSADVKTDDVKLITGVITDRTGLGEEETNDVGVDTGDVMNETSTNNIVTDRFWLPGNVLIDSVGLSVDDEVKLADRGITNVRPAVDITADQDMW